jgi:GNAT superfamily N-acetyltransferase
MKLFLIENRHLEGMSKLYREVFRTKVPISYFQKKYGLSIPGVEIFTVIAEEDGEVVGFIGAIPQEFSMAGRSFHALSLCDYCLIKKHRGTGLFDRMYEHLLQQAIAGGVDIIYAIHSEQTYKLAVLWGWKDLPSFSRFHIKVLPFPLTRIMRTLGLRKIHEYWYRLTMKENQVSNEIDLYNKSESCYTCTYDQKYLLSKTFNNKRYLEFGDSGFIAVKLDSRLTVGFVSIGHDIKIFLDSLKNLARRTLIDNVIIQVQDGTRAYELLSSMLPSKPSYKVSYLRLTGDVEDPINMKVNLFDADMF